MQNNDLIYNSLNKMLLFLIYCFPLLIIFRSAAINIATVMVGIIILFNIFKKANTNFFRSPIAVYLIYFFLFVFINSIYHYQSFELLLKSLGNFRYLLLSAGVFFVLERATKKQIFYFINFNLILVILIGLDIVYQYFFYKDIFGFIPNMCSSTTLICSRFSGIFGTELIAGGYLSQIGLLILLLKTNLNFNIKNFLIPSLFLFLFIVIILTGERNAFLIFMLTIFFISLFKKKLFYFFLICVFSLSVLLILAQKNSSINLRFINMYDGISLSKDSSLIKKIKENPWSYHYQAAIELFL